MNENYTKTSGYALTPEEKSKIWRGLVLLAEKHRSEMNDAGNHMSDDLTMIVNDEINRITALAKEFNPAIRGSAES